MTEFSERSGLFKFLYIFIRIITFPIFIVLFILRHPLYLLLLLLMLAGGAIYWPMSQGIKTDEIVGWYQKKYVILKKDVVKAAKQKGMTDFVPQAVVEDVERQEDIEARKEHGENYNIKIEQDDKSVETKQLLKKRGGFKKAAVVETVQVEKDVEDMSSEEILQESGAQGGGLAALVQQDENTAEEKPVEENADALAEENAADGSEAVAEDTAAETDNQAEEVNLVPSADESASSAQEEEPELDLF